MLVITAQIYKLLIRIGNREDLDQGRVGLIEMLMTVLMQNSSMVDVRKLQKLVACQKGADPDHIAVLS